MNKYDDKLLDVHLEASRKMAQICNAAIESAKEKVITQEEQGSTSLFAQGAMNRATKLANKIAKSNQSVMTKNTEGKIKEEEVEI